MLALRPVLFAVALALCLGAPSITVAATTGTPAAAPTVIPTPVTGCGDGMLRAGETCDSCPADCRPPTCASAGRRTVTIELTPQSGYDKVGAATVLLSFDTRVLGLPGEKGAPAARARVATRQPSAEASVNDLGYGLRAVVSSTQGLTAGPILDVAVDTCAGAPAPTAADVACRVESCALSGARLRQCTCNVTLP